MTAILATAIAAPAFAADMTAAQTPAKPIVQVQAGTKEIKKHVGKHHAAKKADAAKKAM